MKIITLMIAITATTIPTLANAEFYKVYVNREDRNLYIDTYSNLIIKTKFCYEYAYGDQAILIYDQYSYSNKLIFASGTKCDVEWISTII
ncbi:hypothetical protein EC844_11931 [Acinetobacter calcoaceticus]|uniref:Uncharacterized protein n=1 Tax=Acinetobacter calcoaceticus TaxID=471 RepID=A0A4R1XIP1_ACICA|nr:hypothetical protein EC844_11931 [Acinetobacter calcoaceticus]